MASTSSSLVKWIGGILAPVITAVLIYYLTRPAPPPPTPPSIQIEGRVIDLAEKTLVEGAHVTLRVGGYINSQLTDSLGRYGFSVPMPETTEATFEISATGYPHYSVNGTLKKLSEVEDNQLLHEAVGGTKPPVSTPEAPQGNPSAQVGGVVKGGSAVASKSAAIGALAGRQQAAGKPVVSNGVTPKNVIKLGEYVRRPDFVQVGPSH